MRQQPASYPDAEIRGQLRLWKVELEKQYQRFERLYADSAVWGPLVAALMLRGSLTDRKRALQRLRREVGPGAILEGWRPKPQPLAVWSILRSRDSVAVNEAVQTGLMQDCVSVEYIMAGEFPGESRAVLSSGLWTT